MVQHLLLKTDFNSNFVCLFSQKYHFCEWYSNSAVPSSLMTLILYVPVSLSRPCLASYSYSLNLSLMALSLTHTTMFALSSSVELLPAHVCQIASDRLRVQFVISPKVTVLTIFDFISCVRPQWACRCQRVCNLILSSVRLFVDAVLVRSV